MDVKIGEDSDTSAARFVVNATTGRRALQTAGVILAVAVAVALVASVRRDGPAAVDAWREADVQWRWIIVAAGCGLTGHALNVAGWHRLLRDCSVQISWFETARFFAVSNLGRYLPAGKAWQIGIVAVMARELGLPVATLTTSALFGGAVGVLVGLLVLLASAGSTIGLSPWLVALPLLGIMALIVLPSAVQLFPGVVNFLSARVPQVSAVTARTMWTLVWTAAASWLSWAIGLYALALALLPDPAGSLPSYITAWVGSFLAGVVAFVSPAGLGAREVFMQTVLSRSGLAPGGALLIVAVARIGATVLDVLPACIVMAIPGRSREGVSVSEQREQHHITG